MQPENLYFIAILPPPEMQQEIQKIQLLVAEQFKSRKALNAPPHITIHKPFRSKEGELRSIIETLEAGRAWFSPFAIDLNGFGFFGNKTIFLKVNPSQALLNLQKEIVSMLRPKIHVDEEENDQSFSPHISVARRDLKARIFPEAWDYFSSRKFHGSFSVNGFSLMIHEEYLWRETKIISL